MVRDRGWGNEKEKCGSGVAGTPTPTFFDYFRLYPEIRGGDVPS